MNRIDNLENLLSSSNKNQSIIELDNFISAININELSESQKQFYYNQELEREINNGGFSQYFVNSSGDFAHQTVQSLRAIGANKTADILQKAIDQFPGKKVPQDKIERIALVESIEKTANETWNELDQNFFEYSDDLNSLNFEFVKQNKTEF